MLLNQPEYEVTTHVFNNMQLPLTMEPEKYGQILHKEILIDNQRRYIVLNNDNVIFIDVSKDLTTNNVHIKGPLDLKWVDTQISENTFKRELEKNILFIKDGEVLVKSKELSAKPFNSVKLESKIESNETFMTFDIETVNVNGSLHPYLICGYSNGKYIHSYANEVSKDAEMDMFTTFIKKLLKFKNVKYIYAHNLSGFDGILLLKHLIKFEGAKVEPLIFNEKLISIKFIFGTGKTARTLVFKDSYLLLPNTLRKLCIAFSIPTIKSYFPFAMSDINYIGEFPSFETFDPNKTG